MAPQLLSFLQFLVLWGTVVTKDFQDCIDDGGTVILGKVCKPVDYNLADRPQKTTIVNARFTVTDTRDVDETAMTITSHLFIDMTWSDQRISTIENDTSFDVVPVSQDYLKELWTPPTYILNLIKIEEMEVMGYRGEFLIQARNGTVTLRTVSKYHITTSCEMNFQAFPFDVQHCHFRMASTMPVDKILLLADVYFDILEHNLKQFKTSVSPFQENATHVYSGNQEIYSVVGYKLKLKRVFEPYLLSYYSLTLGMVAICSGSFFINPEAIPGRVTMLVTIHLTMASLFTKVLNQVPQTDGLTQVATYILISICFLNVALMEYAFILFRSRRQLMKRSKLYIQIIEDDRDPEDKFDRTFIHDGSKADEIKTIYTDCVIDRAAFFVFVIAYVIFTLISIVYVHVAYDPINS